MCHIIERCISLRWKEKKNAPKRPTWKKEDRMEIIWFNYKLVRWWKFPNDKLLRRRKARDSKDKKVMCQYWQFVIVQFNVIYFCKNSFKEKWNRFCISFRYFSTLHVHNTTWWAKNSLRHKRTVHYRQGCDKCSIERVCRKLKGR